MICDNNSLLFCTGLSLKEISSVLQEKNLENALEQKGKKYLERYNNYKHYKELVSQGKQKQAIVPIFAAMPCGGKTTMSREIATSFCFGNVLGGDSFRAALRKFVDKEKYPEFFSSVYVSWKFFGKETKENIIKGFEAQAKLMNYAMERIIVDRGIRDGESFVCEYLHFLPNQFDKRVLNHPSIIPIVLKLKSEEEYKRRIDVRDKLAHLKGNSSRFHNILDKYLLMQEHQCKVAELLKVPVIETDDFEKAVDKALTLIHKRISVLNKIAEEGKEVEGEAHLIEEYKKERDVFNK